MSAAASASGGLPTINCCCKTGIGCQPKQRRNCEHAPPGQFELPFKQLNGSEANSKTWDGPLVGKGPFVFLSSTCYGTGLPTIASYPRDGVIGKCYMRLWTNNVDAILDNMTIYYTHQVDNQRFFLAVPNSEVATHPVDAKALPIPPDLIFNDYNEDRWFSNIAFAIPTLDVIGWNVDCVHLRHNTPDAHDAVPHRDSPIHIPDATPDFTETQKSAARFFYHVTNQLCPVCSADKQDDEADECA